MSDHSELKRLAEAATPGPWAYDGSYVCPARTEDGTTYVELWRSIADCHQPENTNFIAAANPTAVLALIAEVDQLTIAAKYSEDVDAIPENQLQMVCYDLAVERDQLKAEVERLTADNTSLRGSCAKLGAEHAGMVRQIKKLKGAKP